MCGVRERWTEGAEVEGEEEQGGGAKRGGRSLTPNPSLYNIIASI